MSTTMVSIAIGASGIEKLKTLADETKINWLIDPLQFRYVRETYDLFPFRSRFPLRGWKLSRTHRLIGYADISALAKPKYDRFYRRYCMSKSITIPAQIICQVKQ